MFDNVSPSLCRYLFCFPLLTGASSTPQVPLGRHIYAFMMMLILKRGKREKNWRVNSNNSIYLFHISAYTCWHESEHTHTNYTHVFFFLNFSFGCWQVERRVCVCVSVRSSVNCVAWLLWKSSVDVARECHCHCKLWVFVSVQVHTLAVSHSQIPLFSYFFSVPHKLLVAERKNSTATRENSSIAEWRYRRETDHIGASIYI